MSNTPTLRFGEFDGEWNKELFGNVSSFQQGVQVDVELQLKEPTDGYIKFVRIENYTQKSQDFRYIPKELSNKKTINSNEIAIVRYGATAGFIGRGFDGVLANNLFKLLPNDELLDVEYLFQYLKSYKVFSFFQSEMAGGAMPALSFGIVRALKFPYPTKPEQQKIATFLSAVDSSIEQLSQKEQLLRDYKKGVMQKIFSRQIRFKRDDGGEFEDWETKFGNEVFKNVSNKNHNSDLPILAVTQEHGAIPRDMIEYKMLVTDKSISSYKVIDIGDFIISLRSFQGGIEYSKYKGICSPAYVVLKPIIQIEKDFFKNYFKTYNYIQELNKKLEGIRDGKMISFKYFSEIKLPYPSIEEQTKIANFLSSLDKQIEQVSTQLAETKNFKRGLLQRMFV